MAYIKMIEIVNASKDKRFNIMLFTETTLLVGDEQGADDTSKCPKH